MTKNDIQEFWYGFWILSNFSYQTGLFARPVARVRYFLFISESEINCERPLSVYIFFFPWVLANSWKWKWKWRGTKKKKGKWRNKVRFNWWIFTEIFCISLLRAIQICNCINVGNMLVKDKQELLFYYYPYLLKLLWVSSHKGF